MRFFQFIAVYVLVGVMFRIWFVVSHNLIFCQSFHYLAREKQSKGVKPVQVFRGAYGKLAILWSMCKDGKKII